MKIRAEIIKNDATQTHLIEHDYLEFNSAHDRTKNTIPDLELRNPKNNASNLTIPSEANINFPSYLLNFLDDTTVTKDIIILTNLTRSTGLVYFSLRNDRATSINSFRFKDVLNNDLVINTKTPSFGLFENIYIQFKAVNFFHETSKPVVLKVKVISKTATHKVVHTSVVVHQHKPANILKQALDHLVNKTRVSFQIYSGPQYGILMFNNGNKKEFTVEDVNQNYMLYFYNGTNILLDKMVLKVISTHETFKMKILINVLSPVDLAVPMVTQHKWILIQELSHQLQTKHFDARISERVEENDALTFKLVSALEHGKIVLKTHLLDEGVVVKSFTRYHLKHGLIYYDLNNQVYEMKQEVVTMEVSSGFSALTKKFSFEFIIRHSDSEIYKNFIKPCTEKLNAPIKINNHHPVLLTTSILCYASNTKPSINLKFHITTFPFISNSNVLTDAGKIVVKISNSEITKDERINSNRIMPLDPSNSIKEIDSFTQAMINQTSIYFMPPQRSHEEDKDIANVNAKLIIFKYALTNGDKAIHNQLIFTIPPNNLTSDVFIHIGRTTTLTENFRSLKVPLTQTFKLVTNPLSGVLAIGGQVMKKGQTWTLAQLLSDNVWLE